MHPIWNHCKGKRKCVIQSVVGALGGQTLQTLWKRMTWKSPEKCLCEIQGHPSSIAKEQTIVRALKKKQLSAI